MLVILPLLAIGASPCGADDITTAYGRRDQWQVIDQTGGAALGGARNSARSRTLATSPCVGPCATGPAKRSTQRR
jgi:hypothetical protein